MTDTLSESADPAAPVGALVRQLRSTSHGRWWLRRWSTPAEA